MARSSPSQPGIRLLRVGENLRHALATILRREDIDDDALRQVSITVTQVRPSPDLRHATVFVKPLNGDSETAVIDALNRHSGFVRGHLGKAVRLKYLPALRFVADETFDEANRIEALLASEKVQKDLKAD